VGGVHPQQTEGVGVFAGDQKQRLHSRLGAGELLPETGGDRSSTDRYRSSFEAKLR
jgi:hypothetical protein